MPMMNEAISLLSVLMGDGFSVFCIIFLHIAFGG